MLSKNRSKYLKISTFFYLSLLTTFLVITDLFLFCTQAQIAWDSSKFMPLDQVKIGAKGIGHTVFQGTVVEPFDFVVVSIERDYVPGWHVIWAKGLSDNFKETGVAGGMSGSPCYIDGKLVGALSLGFYYQREHANLFGITSIELMIKATQRGMRPNLEYAGAKPLDLTHMFASQSSTDLMFGDLGSAPIPELNDPKIHQGKNSSLVSMPLAVSARNVGALAQLRQLFETHNIEPIQASAGGAPVETSPIAQGQMVGVEFARGDYNAFSYGTITYIDQQKQQLLAFGHDMYGEGNVNVPLSGGYVHFILPSTNRSSKMASATQPIGTLVQDRMGAIAGTIGKSPSYIPITAKIQTMDGESHDRYFEVSRDRFMSASMAMFGTRSIIDGLESSWSEHTVAIDTRIRIADHPELDVNELTYKNVFSTSGSPGFAAFRSLSTMQNLMQNPFGRLKIEDITVNVKIKDKRNTATIEGLRVEKSKYRPGETIDVSVVLRPYLESPIVHKAWITIPKKTPEGQVILLVSSGQSYDGWQRQRAPLNFQPRNLNQMLKLLQRGESNLDLILEIYIPKVGMTVQGEEFPELPVSMLSVMNTQTQLGEGGYTKGRTLHVEKNNTDYVISGSRFLRLSVNRRAK